MAQLASLAPFSIRSQPRVYCGARARAPNHRDKMMPVFTFHVSRRAGEFSAVLLRFLPAGLERSREISRRQRWSGSRTGCQERRTCCTIPSTAAHDKVRSMGSFTACRLEIGRIERWPYDTVFEQFHRDFLQPQKSVECSERNFAAARNTHQLHFTLP